MGLQNTLVTALEMPPLGCGRSEPSEHLGGPPARSTRKIVPKGGPVTTRKYYCECGLARLHGGTRRVDVLMRWRGGGVVGRVRALGRFGFNRPDARARATAAVCAVGPVLLRPGEL